MVGYDNYKKNLNISEILNVQSRYSLPHGSRHAVKYCYTGCSVEEMAFEMRQNKQASLCSMAKKRKHTFHVFVVVFLRFG